MEILVCIKRVPFVGGTVVLTDDHRQVDTKFLGFTMSPHEECAVEEAVRLVEAHGGSSAVLTVGPPEAEEQLRYAMSLGLDRAVLVDSGARELGPRSVAAEIVGAVEAMRSSGAGVDLLLFGNEAADTGDFQVGILVAEALGLPCVTGVKELEVAGGELRATRERGRAREVFAVTLPAVCTVKEGLNLPRYPSLPGRLRAKSKPLATSEASEHAEQLQMQSLMVPREERREAEVLGHGADAAGRVVEVLVELGVVKR
ncbi:MAG TPA: electron transfer flavoprotein subunit beta/FixA family protein [Acidimicrobiales bacterium]|nr:electron transfer flavoprotein subunit beta/FixA family protein [Acidimicrobiales bacterium]